MAFDPPLSQVMRAVEKDVDKANAGQFEGVALQLFSLIVEETPVDKGIAKGGWQPSVGTPVFKTDPQPNPYATLTSVPLNPKLLPYILSNPLPYIETLEFGGYGEGDKTTGGFSKLAPRGMIRVNMRRLGLL